MGGRVVWESNIPSMVSHIIAHVVKIMAWYRIDGQAAGMHHGSTSLEPRSERTTCGMRLWQHTQLLCGSDNGPRISGTMYKQHKSN